MKNKIGTLIITIIVVAFAIMGACIIKNGEVKLSPTIHRNSKRKKQNNSFNLKLIKRVNSLHQENYLISPYSTEVALNMLKEGSVGNTKEEIRNVIPNRTINNIEILNRIGIANGVFIKDQYKEVIENRFIETLQNNYNSEILYDSFNTPETINNWVNEKTQGMIPVLLDDISKDFVLGLASSLAIDVDWLNQFDCSNTKEYEFTKTDGNKISVEMMNQEYNNSTKYFELDNSKGIIIPYAIYDNEGNTTEDSGRQLEFIGILPNNSVGDYIEKLTDDEIKNIDIKAKESTNDLKHVVNIPRFTYDFDFKEFKDTLNSLGIKDAFDEEKADFTNIISKEKQGEDNLYVSEAVHKTHIEFNEKGTKAAATTYFGISKNMAPQEEKEKIEITFDKPFVYIIRDKSTKEMLFFGKVEEPNSWKGSTCE